MSPTPETTAFAAGNVSCVFKVIADEDPARMHSLGMGFTVAEGVTATVREAPATAVRFNGREMEFPTVRAVLAKLTGAHLEVRL